MNDNINDNMSMTISWSCQCSFIFQSWTCQNAFPFIIGCLICFIIAGVSLILPVIKKWIQKSYFMQKQQHLIVQQQSVRSNKHKKQSILINTDRIENMEQQSIKNYQIKSGGLHLFFLFSYYFIFSTLHVSLMLLIMTMNGYVCLSILFGMTFGYFISGNYQGNYKSSAQANPVNCCTH